MLSCKGKTMSTINLSNKAEEAINEAIKISDGTWSRDFIIECLIDGWLDRLVELNYPTKVQQK